MGRVVPSALMTPKGIQLDSRILDHIRLGARTRLHRRFEYLTKIRPDIKRYVRSIRLRGRCSIHTRAGCGRARMADGSILARSFARTWPASPKDFGFRSARPENYRNVGQGCSRPRVAEVNPGASLMPRLCSSCPFGIRYLESRHSQVPALSFPYSVTPHLRLHD